MQLTYTWSEIASVIGTTGIPIATTDFADATSPRATPATLSGGVRSIVLPPVDGPTDADFFLKHLLAIYPNIGETTRLVQANNGSGMMLSLSGINGTTKAALDTALLPLAGQSVDAQFAAPGVRNLLAGLFNKVQLTVSCPGPDTSAQVTGAVLGVFTPATAPVITVTAPCPRPKPEDNGCILCETLLKLAREGCDLETIPSPDARVAKCRQLRSKHQHMLDMVSTTAQLKDKLPEHGLAPNSPLSAGSWTAQQAWFRKYEDALKPTFLGKKPQIINDRKGGEVEIGAIKVCKDCFKLTLPKSATSEERDFCAKCVVLRYVASKCPSNKLDFLDPSKPAAKLPFDIEPGVIKEGNDSKESKELVAAMKKYMDAYCGKSPAPTPPTPTSGLTNPGTPPVPPTPAPSGPTV